MCRPPRHLLTRPSLPLGRCSPAQGPLEGTQRQSARCPICVFYPLDPIISNLERARCIDPHAGAQPGRRPPVSVPGQLPYAHFLPHCGFFRTLRPRRNLGPSPGVHYGVIVARILFTLILAGCVPAAIPGDRDSADAQRRTGDSAGQKSPALCSYPEGRILVIENRLDPIKVKTPKYSKTAKRLHIQGPVQVIVLVDENGDVVWACGKGDSALTRSAEHAARQCKFPRNFGAPRPWATGRTPVVLFFDFQLDAPPRPGRARAASR